MRQVGIRAVFMRGGTSKALMFHAADLPGDPAARDRIFVAAMGSPDPNGRQLDGMGGGLSSLSKVCIVGLSNCGDADVDYTFGQVAIGSATVDYSGNCGNMSSAVGPFAVDEGIVAASGDRAVVRIFNTNTKKIIVAFFALEGGRTAVDGDFVLPGVAGTGAPIRLDFLDPGGAGTGKLLPTGQVIDELEVPGQGTFEVSMVDAANPCVFVQAETLGVSGAEMPKMIEQDVALLGTLEAIRVAASQRMGIAATTEQDAAKPSIPKVAIVAGPRSAATLSGDMLSAEAADVTVRMISIGQPHRAIPLTGAMCVAVAAKLSGSVVNRVARRLATDGSAIRIAQPSGVTVVDATVVHESVQWRAISATVYRTARRLMDGTVYWRPGS
jgi:2-methylaconitate cis-trans-isomerase PrpF